MVLFTSQIVLRTSNMRCGRGGPYYQRTWEYLYTTWKGILPTPTHRRCFYRNP
ncbi:hypothetical protein BD309DRAFT_955881 [Dichomitus squalens]|nr:hypothetical protein BD309DRAFT_955881 [Dichomitus squalens]